MVRFSRAIACFMVGFVCFAVGMYVVAMPFALFGLWIERRLSGSQVFLFEAGGGDGVRGVLGLGIGFLIGLIADLYLAIRISKLVPALGKSKEPRHDLE